MSDIQIGNLTSMLERQMLGAERSKKIEAMRAESSARSSGGASFSETLENAVSSVNELQKNADESVKELAKGKGSLHETMISMEKADLAIRTITSVRGKLIDAYQEVMRMPV